jgi:hypothetical protein
VERPTPGRAPGPGVPRPPTSHDREPRASLRSSHAPRPPRPLPSCLRTDHESLAADKTDRPSKEDAPADTPGSRTVPAGHVLEQRQRQVARGMDAVLLGP